MQLLSWCNSYQAIYTDELLLSGEFKSHVAPYNESQEPNANPVLLILFANPSAQAGYDTRSIF